MRYIYEFFIATILGDKGIFFKVSYKKQQEVKDLKQKKLAKNDIKRMLSI
ncbi:hypothetical protein pah_c260o034 [Parachlamydia acanthamoebae str. Hall's coccus]|nr:hypothetical protein pah_c260o034 [Parachlamydia acanthamoebae str. Hall's coccus]